MTTHNAQPSYVQYFLGSVYVFFTLFGYLVCTGGGGLTNGLVHKLLNAIWNSLDIVIIYNDHPSYRKHALGCIYVFFTPSFN